MRLLLAAAGLASVVVVAGGLDAAAGTPATPVVSGPRDTTLERPLYRFRARGAAGFRCAFDARKLHACARRYSEPLLPGRHILRVRSVGRSGELSAVVLVRVRTRLRVPQLKRSYTVSVGPGAGVPAPDGVSVWVPVTSTGELVRLDQRDGAVISRATIGAPTASTSALDAVHADNRRTVDRDIWYVSDSGGKVVRLDHGTGEVTATVPVSARPAGLTSASGPFSSAVWAFHRARSTITRIDAVSAAATSVDVPGARSSGITWGDDSVWVLSSRPARILELDDETLRLERAIDLSRSRGDAWWLAGGSGSLWATLPSADVVARVDTGTGAVRYINVPYGTPSGIAVGAGFAWVATEHAVLQLDETSGALRAAAIVPSAHGVMSISFGNAAVWLTNYDRGTLTRLEYVR
jgi:hypothetical protein